MQNYVEQIHYLKETFVLIHPKANLPFQIEKFPYLMVQLSPPPIPDPNGFDQKSFHWQDVFPNFPKFRRISKIKGDRV